MENQQTRLENIDPFVLELLQKNGYRVIRRVGSGHTRDVYEVEYKRGALEKKRVVKIPKLEIDPESITTRINLSKGDLDEREVLALNKVRHPNVVEVYDAFKLGDRTMTIEEYVDGYSLEELVRINRPLSPERAVHIFTQAVSALAHLYENDRLFHRDIKPSNILIDREGRVKITDLQNAGKVETLDEKIMPTRGGTPYTHPSLINALMQEEPAKATVGTELYSLAATLYFAVTGKRPIKLQLSSGTDKTIPLGEDSISFTLGLDGKNIPSLDQTTYRKTIRRAIKEAPDPFRPFLKKWLLGNPINFARSYDDFRFDLALPLREPLITYEGTVTYLKILGVAVAVTAGIAGMITTDISNRKFHAKTPLQHSLERPHGDFPEPLVPLYLGVPRETIAPYWNTTIPARAPLRIVDFDKQNIIWQLRDSGARYLFSAYRSIQCEEPHALSQEYHDRTPRLLVPFPFIDQWAGSLSISTHENDIEFARKDERYGPIVAYARTCMTSGETVADVFAKYFIDRQELFEAQRQAGTQTYLDANGNGYATRLSPLKKRLIERAVAFYTITNDDLDIIAPTSGNNK